MLQFFQNVSDISMYSRNRKIRQCKNCKSRHVVRDPVHRFPFPPQDADLTMAPAVTYCLLVYIPCSPIGRRRCLKSLTISILRVNYVVFLFSWQDADLMVAPAVTFSPLVYLGNLCTVMAFILLCFIQPAAWWELWVRVYSFLCTVFINYLNP